MNKHPDVCSLKIKFGSVDGREIFQMSETGFAVEQLRHKLWCLEKSVSSHPPGSASSRNSEGRHGFKDVIRHRGLLLQVKGPSCHPQPHHYPCLPGYRNGFQRPLPILVPQRGPASPSHTSSEWLWSPVWHLCINDRSLDRLLVS